MFVAKTEYIGYNDANINPNAREIWKNATK